MPLPGSDPGGRPGPAFRVAAHPDEVPPSVAELPRSATCVTSPRTGRPACPDYRICRRQRPRAVRDRGVALVRLADLSRL